MKLLKSSLFLAPALVLALSACKTPGVRSDLSAGAAGGGWGGCDSVTEESRPKANEKKVEALRRLLSIKEFLLRQESSAAVLVTEEGVSTGREASEIAKEAGIADPMSPEGEKFAERAGKGEVVRERASGQIKEASAVAKENAVRLTFGSRLAEAVGIANDFVEQGGNKAEAMQSLKGLEATLNQRLTAPDAFAQDAHGAKIRLDTAMASVDPASLNEATLKTRVDATMNEYYKQAGADRAAASERIAKFLIEAETSARLAKSTTIADALYAKAETATGGNIGLLNNYKLGAYETVVFSSLKNGNGQGAQAAVEAMNTFVTRINKSAAAEVAKEMTEMREITKRAMTEMPRKESYAKVREALSKMRVRLETKPEFKPRTRI